MVAMSQWFATAVHAVEAAFALLTQAGREHDGFATPGGAPNATITTRFVVADLEVERMTP